MRIMMVTILAVLFSTTTHAGTLFPPEGTLPNNKCPAGTIIYWTGIGLACTPISIVLAIPTCIGESALQFDGTAFSCLEDFNAASTACPVQCRNLPNLNYCHAFVPLGTTNNVPANTVIKKSDKMYAAVQGTTAEKTDCVVNGVGGLICTYGCSNGTWMFLNSRRRDVF